jgi:hypothetical protein
MSQPFSILERICGSDRMHQISAEELRTLCSELSAFGSYQILAGHREGDSMDQIEVFVTYGPKEKQT